MTYVSIVTPILVNESRKFNLEDRCWTYRHMICIMLE